MEYWRNRVMVSRSSTLCIRKPDALCLKLQKIGFDSSFFQYAITPILHKCNERSRVIERPFPGGKPKPGLEGLDSLFRRVYPAVINRPQVGGVIFWMEEFIPEFDPVIGGFKFSQLPIFRRLGIKGVVVNGLGDADIIVFRRI